MDYFSIYESRMKSKGNDQKDSRINSTKQIINNSFMNSPALTKILVNDAEYEVLLSNSTSSSLKKEVVFKPDTMINIGEVIKFENEDYLSVDFFRHEFSPKAIIKKCNSTYPLKTTTKTKVGEDDFGRPVYSEEITIENLPCIAENKIAQRDNDINDRAVNVVDNRLWLTLPYKVHSDISINTEVVILGDTYKVVNVDKTQSDMVNETGILILHAERVVNNT